MCNELHPKYSPFPSYKAYKEKSSGLVSLTLCAIMRLNSLALILGLSGNDFVVMPKFVLEMTSSPLRKNKIFKPVSIWKKRKKLCPTSELERLHYIRWYCRHFSSFGDFAGMKSWGCRKSKKEFFEMKVTISMKSWWDFFFFDPRPSFFPLRRPRLFPKFLRNE